MMFSLRLVVPMLVLLSLGGCVGNNSAESSNDPNVRAVWSDQTPPGTKPINGPTQNDATH